MPYCEHCMLPHPCHPSWPTLGRGCWVVRSSGALTSDVLDREVRSSGALTSDVLDREVRSSGALTSDVLDREVRSLGALTTVMSSTGRSGHQVRSPQWCVRQGGQVTRCTHHSDVLDREVRSLGGTGRHSPQWCVRQGGQVINSLASLRVPCYREAQPPRTHLIDVFVGLDEVHRELPQGCRRGVAEVDGDAVLHGGCVLLLLLQRLCHPPEPPTSAHRRQRQACPRRPATCHRYPRAPAALGHRWIMLVQPQLTCHTQGYIVSSTGTQCCWYSHSWPASATHKGT